ncbi:hypothetical protein AB9P05_00715 [Roseivirga sp. BDSF3-8]|uniref:hypothetical protein n=1 Tax=Roseivirga sp. BDSF3-8 TaxID=3241598 RepID=UPI003531C6C2
MTLPSIGWTSFILLAACLVAAYYGCAAWRYRQTLSNIKILKRNKSPGAEENKADPDFVKALEAYQALSDQLKATTRKATTSEQLLQKLEPLRLEGIYAYPALREALVNTVHRQATEQGLTVTRQQVSARLITTPEPGTYF